MAYPINTAQTRKAWVRDNLARIDAEGWTARHIAANMQAYFGTDKPMSMATIGRYLEEARKAPSTLTGEALRLLRPENFPEWREVLFGYQTSTTQHALYYMLRCLAIKEPIPDWVLEHFELPPEVNDDLIEKDKLLTFMLLMAPRHGKTMTMVHGLIALYCEFPDLRVIYCQGVATTTEAINALVMIELEHNKKLADTYGPFRDDDRQWSRQKGFVLASRERHSITNSFQPVGINSNVRSLDADILIIDDPQDLTRAESEKSTSDDYRKITAEFMTRREPHTPVLMVGSHLPTLFGDVWSQIEDNLDDIRTEGQDIYINKRPAHDDDKCKVWTGEETEHYECLEWPEFRNWNFLEAQRALLGDELYQAVYQQDARVEGTRPFPPSKVKSVVPDGILDPERSWKEEMRSCPRCGGKVYNGMGFDPAAGESKRASYTALAYIQGCIKCHTLHLIDYEQKRQSPDMHPGTIDSWTKSFDVHLLRIEINAYQKALARDPRVLEASRTNRFNIDEWMTDDRKNTPEFGIPQLANHIRDNKFTVPAKTDGDLDYGRELEKALIRYPKKPDDIPMALWLAAGAVWMLWEQYANLDPIYLRGRQENVPAYMIDAPLRVNLGLISANME